MTVLAVVLAAGGGARFRASGGQGPKQLATVTGEALVARALRAALLAGLDQVAVVQGAADLRAAVPDGVVVLDNPGWAAGVATSLQVALAYATTVGHTAVLVGLGDQPGVSPEAWAALAAAEERPIAIATYAGRRGHPVRLSAAVWADLPRDGDEGARTLMRARPDLVVEVPCAGDPADIDTVDDLRRWS